MDDVPQDNADVEPPVLWDCRDAKDMISRLRVRLGVSLDKIGFGGVATGAPLAPVLGHGAIRSSDHVQALVPIYAGKFIEKVELVVPSLVRL